MTEIRRSALLRLSLLASVAILALMAIGSARAEADTVCVAKSDPTCTGVPYTAAQFQNALTFAQNNGTGPDTILVGPVTVGAGTTGFAFHNQGPNGVVHIIGSGQSATKIAGWNTTGAATGMNFDAAPGSTISDLTIDIPANADGTTDTGLLMSNDETAQRISVTGASADNARGIWSYGGDVIDSIVDLPTGGTNTIALDESNQSLDVINSSLKGEFGARHTSFGATTKIDHSTITSENGAVTDGGNFDITDSIINVLPGVNSFGIGLMNPNNGNALTTATVDGTTIAGQGAGTGNGIIVQADSVAEDASLDISNTVIAGTDASLRMVAAANRTIHIHAAYSMFDQETIVNTATGGGAVDYTAGAGVVDLAADPGFTDAAAKDFSLKATSPLIDVGDSAAPAAGRTDFAGSPRACHGTSAGIIRRDIGAFEYKTNPADDCTYPETTIDPKYGGAAGSNYVEIPMVSSKPGSTFRCSLDDAPAVACTSPYKSTGLHDSSHKLSAAAVDAYGNVDQTPASVNFTLYKGTGDTCFTIDPSTCPPEGDVTPPKVLNLKAAKKTKKKRVKVTFRSNEKKVIFTCQLNKKKPKRCKSPWKTPKLKNGKNVVSVWATDAAGNRSGIKKRVIRRK